VVCLPRKQNSLAYIKYLKEVASSDIRRKLGGISNDNSNDSNNDCDDD
jgi:hypothetical protein